VSHFDVGINQTVDQWLAGEEVDNGKADQFGIAVESGPHLAVEGDCQAMTGSDSGRGSVELEASL
jgi:hypothetical protein